jgi:hypothetical protein
LPRLRRRYRYSKTTIARRKDVAIATLQKENEELSHVFTLDDGSKKILNYLARAHNPYLSPSSVEMAKADFDYYTGQLIKHRYIHKRSRIGQPFPTYRLIERGLQYVHDNPASPDES